MSIEITRLQTDMGLLSIDTGLMRTHTGPLQTCCGRLSICFTPMEVDIRQLQLALGPFSTSHRFLAGRAAPEDSVPSSGTRPEAPAPNWCALVFHSHKEVLGSSLGRRPKSRRSPKS